MIPLGFEMNNKKISLNIYDKNGIKIYSSCKNSSIQTNILYNDKRYMCIKDIDTFFKDHGNDIHL